MKEYGKWESKYVYPWVGDGYYSIRRKVISFVFGFRHERWEGFRIESTANAETVVGGLNGKSFVDVRWEGIKEGYDKCQAEKDTKKRP